MNKYEIGSVVCADFFGEVEGAYLNAKGEMLYDIRTNEKLIVGVPEKFVVPAPTPDSKEA